jgi:site-specific recombinase XerD
VWRCIEAYLPHRHNVLEKTGQVGEKALLVNRLGKRIKPENISELILRLAKRKGIAVKSLHQFRHSCASDLLESGASLPEVQKILGHAVIQSTFRYTSIVDPQKKKAIARHPINEFLAGAGTEVRKAS